MTFKDVEYKELAKKILSSDEINLTNNISNEDAFLILINELDIKKLDNLCNKLKDKLGVTFEEAYKVTQNLKDSIYKKQVFELALEIILKEKGTLGTEIVNEFNTSDFINHCVREAAFSYEVATMLRLDGSYAFNYGLLHDYGRKFTHKFEHIIKGFEALSDLKLYDFAKASLTHSFINGGKYCCNEGAKEGFSVDQNGKEHYLDKEEYDDIYYVLNTSSYNIYDYILNLADLMATSYDIVSPEERINDIAKRRPNVDAMPNRKYFLASFTNLLIDFLNRMGVVTDINKVDFNKSTLDEIKTIFSSVSKAFYEIYKIKKRVWNIEYSADNKEKKNTK